MPTLKKPFSLLLILSHLNAFVLSGVGNAYAVNQEVNTANVNVATNGVLNISSVQDSKSVQMKSSPKSLFSSSVSATTKATTTNIASNLTANNLTIETTKEDINITGSNIDAQQQLSLNSAKDINIKAGYNGSLNESYHKTSGLSLGGLVGIGPLYTSTEDLEGRIKKTAVNSTLSGNNITLNANNNINAAGVNIQADNSISGTAKDINIQNVNNTDTHYSKHKKVKVSLADVLGTIAKNPLLLKKESDGKVSLH
ncbi:hypothetical protein BSPWISOXPB_5451 [uncultured Gammaproteobacteria bacterium]|nr:hypothetical protein BSPWISOXPB_5451 [uncultured Gammaproteobacteria bacterium]